MAKGKKKAKRGGGKRGFFKRSKRGTSKLHQFLGWAQKPSKVIAVGGAVTAAGTLVITPLPNGDSWYRRLLIGYQTYQQSGNAIDILGQDIDGNNAISVGIDQLKQNIVPAAIIAGITGITAGFLKRYGL